MGTSAALNGTRYLGIEPEEELLHPNIDDYSYPGPELRHGPHFLESGRFKIYGRKKADILTNTLKKSFKALPGPTELKHKDYAIVNVAPSIIPTYLPAARIYSYNISGVSNDLGRRKQVTLMPPDDPSDPLKKPKKDSCAKPENENKPHCSFKTKPRYSSPQSPSRTNKPLTVLGYTQFFIPNLDDKRSKVPPGWEIEYSTFKAQSLLPDSINDDLGKEPYGQPPPVPYHLLPGFDPDIVGLVTNDDLALLDGEDEYEDGKDVIRVSDDGKDDDDESVSKRKDEFLAAIKRITPWKLKDLTIKSYVKFGRKLAKEKKAFKKFMDLMFVSSCPGTTC